VLGGQVAVFLSCSERFKQAVAWQVRDVLAEHGLRGLIVSDELPLPGTRGDPGAKVASYLDASSAFVALCTADHELSDGTMYPRANIIEEIELARLRPRLRDHCQILTAPGILLPSSMTATYDRLDVSSPAGAAVVIVKQLVEWGVTSPPSPARAACGGDAGTDPAGELSALFAGLRPGEHDEARRRVYRRLLDGTRDDGRRTADVLHREVMAAQDPARQLTGAVLLEAMARLDASLVSAEMIEALAADPEYPPRSCAARLLRDRAVAAPFDVPLGVLGRLAWPSAEDWYVWMPAMAAVKELVLTRHDAFAIFEWLGASAEPQDRHAVAQALLQVAAVKPAAVARNLAARLAGDPDPLVAHEAGQVMTTIQHVSDADRAACYARFGS
jgi:hypothetical protein